MPDATLAPDMVKVSITAIDALANDHLGAWLTSSERTTYAALIIPKRRREWLAGRVAAKSIIAQRHNLRSADRFTRITITPIADGPERGRPRYTIDAQPAPYDLSIAHCGDIAIAALATHPGERIGVDLEHLITAGPGFDALTFSPAELATLATLPTSLRPTYRTHLWTLKEALLKATGTGLRTSLPDVSVQLSPTSRDAITLASAPHARAGLFQIDALIGAWVVA